MNAATGFTCPMHGDVHSAVAGKCPHCHMQLVPEGAKFGIVRHMVSSPLHIAVMIVVMVAIMAGIMMMR